MVGLLGRVDLIGKTLLHAMLVGGAGVFQAERHGEVAIRAEWGNERGHELVIARIGIQKREYFTS
jgi:hypothetical protein